VDWLPENVFLGETASDLSRRAARRYPPGSFEGQAGKRVFLAAAGDTPLLLKMKGGRLKFLSPLEMTGLFVL